MGTDELADSWRSTAPGPYLTLDGPHGTIAVQTLGEGRFVVTGAGEREEEIVGFDLARVTAGELAGRPPLGVSAEDYDPGEWGDDDAAA